MELIRPKDESENVKLGNVLTVDSKNNIIMSDKQLVATLGINDLIVVATGDTIMVCPKNRAQDIRQIIQALDKDPARKRYL
jgi:mannose-1-phosphate guanylyltransferase